MGYVERCETCKCDRDYHFTRLEGQNEWLKLQQLHFKTKIMRLEQQVVEWKEKYALTQKSGDFKEELLKLIELKNRDIETIAAVLLQTTQERDALKNCAQLALDEE